MDNINVTNNCNHVKQMSSEVKGPECPMRKLENELASCINEASLMFFCCGDQLEFVVPLFNLLLSNSKFGSQNSALQIGDSITM